LFDLRQTLAHLKRQNATNTGAFKRQNARNTGAFKNDKMLETLPTQIIM
jgi:hypothetical protein